MYITSCNFTKVKSNQLVRIGREGGGGGGEGGREREGERGRERERESRVE